MARLVFPDQGSQLVYTHRSPSGVPGEPLQSTAHQTLALFVDAALTTLADIHTYPGDVAIPSSEITINADSLMPLFYGPADGTDTLYDQYGTAIYARTDDRIDSEILARIAGDATNAGSVTTEAAARAAADTAEATTRAAADTALAASVTAEATARSAADTAEAATRAAADTALSNALAQEVLDRQNAATQQLVWAAGVYPARTSTSPVQWIGPVRPAAFLSGDTWLQQKGGLLTEIASLSGLVGYWPCDEGSGSTVTDRTASPVNGAVTGTGAVLKPWPQPGGTNALGLRPGTAQPAFTPDGQVALASNAKWDLGDNFTFGVFLRRRGLRQGTVIAHGASLYGALGAELLGNINFETAPIPTGGSYANGNWKTVNSNTAVTVDSAVFHGGAGSFKVAVDSANGAQTVQQPVSSAPAGRYVFSYWTLDDASNANGKSDLVIQYTPAAGGSQKNLQPDGSWAVNSNAIISGTHASAWTQRTVTFDLPEVTGTGFNGLLITLKRQAGAGGGVAYNFWLDDATLKYLPAVAGGWAIAASDVFALKAGAAGGAVTTVASSPALTDHLGWHLVVVSKAGATTKVYVDSADVTVAGTNTTIASGAAAMTLFGGTDFGQLDAVVAHAFLLNRGITAPEVTAIYGEANMLPDKVATNLRVGTNNYSLSGTQLDGYRGTYARNLRSMNVQVSREAIQWGLIESPQGTFDWTATDDLINNLFAQGIEIHFQFDGYTPAWAAAAGGSRAVPSDVTLTKGLSVASAGAAYATWRGRFMTFITAAVNRYKAKVHYWEVLNEWSASIFSAPAASAPLYVDFYNTARAAILAVDSTAHIMVCGLPRMIDQGTTDGNSYLADEWLRAVLDGGIGTIDILPGHPYPSNNSTSRAHTTSGVSVDQLHRLRDTLMEYGRTATRVWLNEIGHYSGITKIAAASSGVSLPAGTINVDDTTFMSASGTVYTVNSAGTITSFAYTGKTGTTLTGCTGGAGALVTGSPVSFGSQTLTEQQQAAYMLDTINVVRDYFSRFCDVLAFFSVTPAVAAGAGTGLLDGSCMYLDYAMTKPKDAIGQLSVKNAAYLAQYNDVDAPATVTTYPTLYVATGSSWVRVAA